MRLIIFFLLFLTKCAFPHHFTMGDLDATSAKKKHFQILVSETGFNFEQGIAIAQAGMMASNAQGNLEGAKDLEYVKLAIQLSTMGPVTGRKTFNNTYGDELAEIVYQHCKSGKIVNLKNIRESAQYPVVSGEIIRIEGDCLE